MKQLREQCEGKKKKLKQLTILMISLWKVEIKEGNNAGNSDPLPSKEEKKLNEIIGKRNIKKEKEKGRIFLLPSFLIAPQTYLNQDLTSTMTILDFHECMERKMEKEHI